MEKHEAVETVGKDATDYAALVDAISDTLLAKAREALKTNGSETRRQIVRTELNLHRLLSEVIA